MYKKVIKTKTYQFIALSDGKKRTYYNVDGLKEYPDNIIRDPRKMSYINLFINGVLQPEKNYRVRSGELSLKTIDAPPAGAPVILQFIKMYLVSKRKRIRKKNIPLTYESEDE